MTPGPGDSATWRQPSARVTHATTTASTPSSRDALSSMDDIQEQLDRAETALSVRAWEAYREGSFQGAGTHREFAMIRYYNDIEQGGEEWLALRRGILTASEMRLILTPTARTASNDKERAHLFEILGQRITGYTEPHYISDDMLRGHEDEIGGAHPIRRAFRSGHGMRICDQRRSRRGDRVLTRWPCRRRRPDRVQESPAEIQIETILADEVPAEYPLQCQTGLLVTGRKWLDFISYCGGLPMLSSASGRARKFSMPSSLQHRHSSNVGGCSGLIRRMAKPPAGRHPH